jgi:deoxyribose-phosphate aldolase
VLAAIEHTALAATTTTATAVQLCAEAVEHGFGGVCVLPVHVATCRTRLAGTRVRVVTVVGFPLGAHRTETKVREAELARADGADELDVVMRLTSATAGLWDEVEADVGAVVAAAAGSAVKVILETGALDDAQKARACACAVAAGAAFVKTCTGFGPGSATVADVELMARSVAGRARVKASGGIRTLAQARALLAAGASRLGTSASVAIARELASLV